MIKMWATEKGGDGHVMLVGEYDEVSDIEIRTSIFGPDVVISFEETWVKEANDCKECDVHSNCAKHV